MNCSVVKSNITTTQDVRNKRLLISHAKCGQHREICTCVLERAAPASRISTQTSSDFVVCADGKTNECSGSCDCVVVLGPVMPGTIPSSGQCVSSRHVDHEPAGDRCVTSTIQGLFEVEGHWMSMTRTGYQCVFPTTGKDGGR